jgi:hypothetical protein
MQSKQDRRRAGKATGPLLGLVLLIGLGGYNYHRNWQSEQVDQGPRPFETYETADLTALRDAYEVEAAQYEQRYSAQERQRYRSKGEGLMGERVEDFERIQRNSGRLRELSADVADRQARMRDIERELDIRLAQANGLALHMKRLISL